MPPEMATGPVETPAVVDDTTLDPYSTYTLRAPDQRAWSPVARLAKAPDLAPTRLRFTRVGARRPSRQSMLPARLPPRPPSDQSMEPVRLPPATTAAAEERVPVSAAASTRSSSGSGVPKMSQSGRPPSGRGGGGGGGGGGVAPPPHGHGKADDAMPPGCKGGGGKPHRGLRGLLSSLTRSKAAPPGGGKRALQKGADPRGGNAPITAVVPAPSRAVTQLDGRLCDRGAVGGRPGSPPSAAARLTSERLAAAGALDLGAAAVAGRAKAAGWAGGAAGAPALQGRCSVDGPGRVMGGRSSVEFRVPAGGLAAGRGAPPPALLPPAAPTGRTPKRGAPKREAPAARPAAPAHRGAAAAAAAAAAGGRGGAKARPAGGPRGGVVLGGRSSLDGRAIAAHQGAAARAAAAGPAAGANAGRGRKGAAPAAGGKAGGRRRK